MLYLYVKDCDAYYQRALKESPQFPEALLNLGHALMATGQEEEARSCLVLKMILPVTPAM